MKKEKITMKDIAKELNISLATVSYVLNHSEKEKISHDTRIKVIETAKRLGYTPNQTSKSLVNKKSNLIGIIVNLSNNASTSMKFQSLDLASELQNHFYNEGYDAIISITHELEDIEIKYKHSLDAVFVIDISEKSLKKVTKKYYIPIIFMDCDFEEGLFYKILPDYSAMIQRAKDILEDEKPYLVMESLINENIKNQIINNFPREDIFINNTNSKLKEFLAQRKSRKGIIIGDLLASWVERYVDNNNIVVLSSNKVTDILLPDTKRIIVSNEQKAEIAVNIFNQLILLDCNNDGHTRILLQPDN